MVGVAAHLGGQVEGNREPGLAGLDEILETGISLFGGAEARILAHGPGPAAVHRWVDATHVRVLARVTKLLDVVEAVPQVLWPVEGLYLDAGLRPALLATFLDVHPGSTPNSRPSRAARRAR